jgi:hypothetical protein
MATGFNNRHLSRREFVDVIDASPSLPVDRAQHAETCAVCRERADMLRAMRGLAAADALPEPSPLFWEHFASRVAENVRREPVPEPARRWIRGRFAMSVAAATVAALLISVAVWRATLHAPAPSMTTQMSAPADVVTAEPADDLENDEAWAVVRAAAADLAWEDAHEAGITPRPGELENEALQLNAAERVELERLLDEDMKRNGA